MVAVGLILCLLQTTLSLHMNWRGTAKEEGQLGYLHDLLWKVNEEHPIRLILVMQHSQDNDCLLQKLFLPDWPVLRFDEMSRIKVSTLFNKEALALVCLCNPRQWDLLTSLAFNFNGMREARIIIWMESYETRELLSVIAREADRHRFYNVIVLQAKPRILLHRMQPFPLASFEQPSNESSGRIFVEHCRNFQGKKALTRSLLTPPNTFFVTDPKTGEKKLAGFSYSLLKWFTLRYNISLSVYGTLNESAPPSPIEVAMLIESGKIDISANIYSLNYLMQSDAIQGAHFVRFGNLMYIVPCGNELSFQQIFDNFFIKKGIFSLVVYIVWSLVETLVTSFNNYFTENRFQFRLGHVLLNLRVIRYILGLASPIRRRSSASLRQIIVVSAFIGLFYSCWFNAKISTLLTKHPRYKQIETFEDLAKSPLQTVIGSGVRIYREYFKHAPSNVITIPLKDHTDLILSLNTSYVYMTHSLLWNSVFYWQKMKNIESLCTSKSLSIAEGFPMSFALQNNSVYSVALDTFIQNAQSAGLDNRWTAECYVDIFTKMKRNVKLFTADIGNKPLRLEQFRWIWNILVFGQSLGFLAFLIELGMGYRQRRRLRGVEIAI